jgi:hypothetical protein
LSVRKAAPSRGVRGRPDAAIAGNENQPRSLRSNDDLRVPENTPSLKPSLGLS